MAPVKFNFPAFIGNLGDAFFNAGAILTAPLLHAWFFRWGASKAEVGRPIPGDNLVPFPKLQSTRAITILARPQDIWPWLVQISSRQAIARPQTLELGTQIKILTLIPLFTVDIIEPNQLLIYIIRTDTATGNTYSPFDKRPEHYINCTRAFFLEKVNERETRVISRSRFDYTSSFSNTLVWRLFTDSLNFVMERKMLLGIKKQVESQTRINWSAARKVIGLK